MTQATLFRCDKCGEAFEQESARRRGLDLCRRHRAEFQLWISNPAAWVSTAEPPAPPAPTEPASPKLLELERAASGAGLVFRNGGQFKPPKAQPKPQANVVSPFPAAPGRMPHQQPACTQIKRAPTLAQGMPTAPVRAGATATPLDSVAPARPVAPGFPLPGAAPDPGNERAAAKALAAPVMPLLTEPPPPPPDDDDEPEGSEPPPSVAPLEPPPLEPLEPPPAAAAPVDPLDDCTCRVKATLEMDPTSQIAHGRTCAAGARIIAEQMERAQAQHRAMLARQGQGAPPATTGQGLHMVPPPVPTLPHNPRVVCRCAMRTLLLQNPAAVVVHARACPLYTPTAAQAVAHATDAELEAKGFILPPDLSEARAAAAEPNAGVSGWSRVPDPERFAEEPPPAPALELEHQADA